MGRRIPELSEFRRLTAVPDPRGAWIVPVEELAGVGLTGQPLNVALRRPSGVTLALFLAADCDGCRELWSGAGEVGSFGLGPADQLVVVVRDPVPGGRATPPGRRRRRSGRRRGDREVQEKREDPAAVRRLTPPGATVVFSGAAWRALRVSGPPFFVLVEGSSGRVLSEGLALGPSQVAEHVGRALSPGRAE